MPLRPFALPLSIGIDIIHVNRIRTILVKAQNNPHRLSGFLRRFLTPREQDAFTAQYQITDRLDDTELDLVSKHLAGRWAAKEAAIKAVTWRRLSFHDIVILRSPQRGGLSAIILDRVSAEKERDQLHSSKVSPFQDLDGQVAQISISHDGEYATAVCMAVEEPLENDVGSETAAREAL